MEYTKSFLKNHLKVMVTNSDLYVYGGVGWEGSPGGSHTNKQFFTSGGPTIQLKSDTIYLEIVKPSISAHGILSWGTQTPT